MPDSLRIHTHEFYPKRGGIGRYCHELAKSASKQGWITTVCGSKSSNYLPGDSPHTYKICAGAHNSSLGIINLIKGRRQLSEDFLKHQESLHLLAEPGPILTCGLISPKMYPKRMRIVLHGSEIERWSALNSVARHIAMRSLEAADSIIVPSQVVADNLISSFPNIKNCSRIVHHALPQTFRTAAQKTRKVRVNRSTKKLKLLSVGRIHPRKGFDQVLLALKKLSPSEQKKLDYTIVGSRCNQNYERRLRRLAKETTSKVNFILDPSDEQLTNIYQNSCIFILTCLPRLKSIEGFGLVYLEAAAFGLPSIAYPTGGVAAAVQNGETGYLLPDCKPYCITEQLKAILKRPEDCVNLGLKAQQKAFSRNWSKVVEESLH